MQEDEHDSFVDALLDAGLAQYHSVEARPGLENRILARLRTEQKAASWQAWAWWVGASLAAAGVILALVSVAYRQRLQTPISAPESPRPARMVEASRNTAAALPAHPFTRRHSEPRRVEHAAELQAAGGDLLSKSVAGSRLGKPGATEVAQSPAGPEGRRLDVFPSPAPLSEEERLLVRLVRQSPDEALAAFPEQGKPVASLRVPDLKIPPLESNDPAANGTDPTR
jgi:hypothetical protein